MIYIMDIDLTDTTKVDSAALQEVTLMNIQQLQKMEQKLYQELESMAANEPSATANKIKLWKKSMIFLK